MSIRKDGQHRMTPTADNDTDASMLPEDWAEALRKRGYDVDRLATLVAGIYDGASP